MTQKFSDLLTMQELEAGRFQAEPAGGPTGFLFGGLTMGLALTAAGSTIDEPMTPLSIHCSFVSFGQWGPMDIEIEPLSSSRSIAIRSARVRQGEKLVAAASVTFHRPEEGTDIQSVPAPQVPGPMESSVLEAYFGAQDRVDPIEIRVPWSRNAARGERIHPYWARLRETPAAGPVGHAAGLAFISDYLVVNTPFDPEEGGAAGLSSFTLEHNLWFHRPFKADDWILFDCEAFTVSGGRFVSRGTAHDERRSLVASFVQEGLIRTRR